MQRVAAGERRGTEEPIDIKVTLGCAGRADADGAVGELSAEAAAVGVRHDEDRLETLVETRAQDPHRDLAAVGDQDPRQSPHEPVSPQGR